MVDVQVLERRGIGVEAESVDVEAVKRHAGRAISKLGYEVREAQKDERAWQLFVTVQLTAERGARSESGQPAKADEVFRQAAIGLDLKSIQGGPRYNGMGSVEKNVRVFDGFDALISAALDRAVKDIELSIELAEAPASRVIARLKDPDALVQARAIEAAGDRRVAEALPLLIEVLADDNEETDVVFKTIGALVRIGDERAVGPLIDSARRRPPVYLGQIIFGVAQIGGREAEAYLFTVSSGHPDPEIRTNAKDALEEMQRAGRGAKESPEDG